MGYLVGHPWPGNIRELRNALAHAATSALGGEIEDWMLPPSITVGPDPVSSGGESAPPEAPDFRPIEQELAELESRRMQEALDACGGIQRRAAALIRMPLRTFQAKCKKYALGSASGRVRLIERAASGKGAEPSAPTSRIRLPIGRREPG
jgi:DNA-binding NtrC family response regulator